MSNQSSTVYISGQKYWPNKGLCPIHFTLVSINTLLLKAHFDYFPTFLSSFSWDLIYLAQILVTETSDHTVWQWDLIK